MTFTEFRNQVQRLLEEGKTFSGKIEAAAISEQLEEIQQHLKKNELIIVVCGEVKRGKSSLLTALLGEQDLFPVNMDVATNTVSIVRYAEKEKIEVVFEDNQRQTINRSEISAYVTEQGNAGNLKKVSCLNIWFPHSLLKEGLVFVDTPGVGSLNFSHSEVTYGFLPNADIVLFVSDAQNPLTVPELNFLKRAVKLCKNVIYPLTKCDLNGEYQTILLANQEKIIEYTGTAAESVSIIPVSSQLKLMFNKTKSPLYLKQSNYRLLEETIWRTAMEKRVEILMLPPLNEFSLLLSSMRNNLKVRAASLTQTKEALQKMDVQLKATLKQKQQLLEEGAEWRLEIANSFNFLGNDLRMKVQNHQPQLESLINSLISPKNASRVSKNLEEIGAEVNDNLLTLVNDIREQILKEAQEISNRTAEKLGLNIAAGSEVLRDFEIALGDIPIDKVERDRGDQIILIGREISMKTVGGGLSVSLLGGIVGGTVGFFVGGPAGAYAGAQGGAYVGGIMGSGLGLTKGLVDGVKTVKGKDIPTINQSFKKYGNRKSNEILTMTNALISKLIYEITLDLSRKIKAQSETISQDILLIQSNIGLTKEQAGEETKVLSALVQELNGLESRNMQFIRIASGAVGN